LPASLGAYRVAYRRDHLVGESPYDVAGFDPAEDVSADAVDQRELGELLYPHRRRPLEETLAVSAELAADVVDADAPAASNPRRATLPQYSYQGCDPPKGLDLHNAQ
jgi:hypothetical protein